MSGDQRRCIWCGLVLAGSREAPRLLRCSRCGVLLTDPLPSAEELDSAYAGPYRPPSGRFSGPLDSLLAAVRTRIGGRIDRLAPPGAVLDIGSGGGELVAALQRRGREAHGVEREPGSEGLGLPDPPDGGWAAVVLWHSLEHLPEPGRLLDAIAGLLEPRGLLVVAMPNEASLQSRAFGGRWFALDLPRHLVHVPTAALIERLEGAGLAIEHVGGLRGGQAVFGWLHGIVGALPGAPDLYDAIRRPPARQAPIGAPARALALTAAALLLPIAVGLALLETALGRGAGSYVEARRV